MPPEAVQSSMGTLCLHFPVIFLAALALGCSEAKRDDLEIDRAADTVQIQAKALSVLVPYAHDSTSNKWKVVLETTTRDLIVSKTEDGVTTVRRDGAETLNKVLVPHLERLRLDTWNAYWAANSKPLELSNLAGSIRAVATMNTDEIHAWFEKHGNNGYDKLLEQFSGAFGIVELSAPGISSDGHQALVQAGIQSSMESGHGCYLLHEQKIGRWIVVDLFQAWIS